MRRQRPSRLSAGHVTRLAAAACVWMAAATGSCGNTVVQSSTSGVSSGTSVQGSTSGARSTSSSMESTSPVSSSNSSAGAGGHSGAGGCPPAAYTDATGSGGEWAEAGTPEPTDGGPWTTTVCVQGAGGLVGCQVIEVINASIDHCHKVLTVVSGPLGYPDGGVCWDVILQKVC
jgi:hypothetical protein